MSAHRFLLIQSVALVCLFLVTPASAQFVMYEADFCVTDLGPAVGPKGGECSPGGIWGDYIYFGDSSANLIDRVDFFDNMSVFVSGPPDISFPVGMAFGPGPLVNFGDYLYVASNSSNRITRVTPGGVPSLFVNITSPGDVTFDPTGAYGGDLFVTSAFTGPISKVTSTGVISTFSTVFSTYIRFGPGGAWGTGLYSTSQDATPGIGITQVDVAGTATLFAGGFTTPEGFDWGFGPGFDGDMFVPDLSTGEIWRIQSDGTKTLYAKVNGASSVTFCNGDLYVTSFAGGCYKVEFCGVTQADPFTWGSVKGQYR